jgi:hypothetical protein
MGRMSIGSNYTPRYSLESRINKFCNNNPLACKSKPRIAEDIYKFVLKDYTVPMALSLSNYNYDISYNHLYDASYNYWYDVSFNNLYLEYNLNQNNININSVSISPNYLYYNYSYNEDTGILSIFIEDANPLTFPYANIYVVATTPLSDQYTLTLNYIGGFSDLKI